MSTFLELGLKEPIIKALTDLGYEKPTVIQEKAIPQIISSTDDLKAFAQTGTGKTAAFSLPIIELLEASNNNVQAIILSPTRELAVQIGNNIKDFCKYIKDIRVTTVYGGSSIEDQIRSLKKGSQIVVGTPGRTVDLINRRALKLGNVQWLVLDEADEMLNMGFKDELDKVLEATPETKQTLLFSATFPREVESIARNYMTKPVEITSGQKNQGSDNVSHEYYSVTERTRYPALKRIADLNPNIYAIIFCRTRRETQEVADNLIKDGYSADSLHGDLSQAQRDSVMGKFRKKTIQILVATDVAARGLDVSELTHVINHKLPDQIENYTHRSGRTGRAGKSGISMVIVSRSEVRKIKSIEKIIKKEFTKKEVPSGMEICEVQLKALANKIHDTEINHEIDPYLNDINNLFKDVSKDELIKKFFSVEFTRFFNYYRKTKDLNSPNEGNHVQDYGKEDNSTRFFINIGNKDGYDWMKLKDFLRDTLQLSQDDVYKVDVKDSFAFFNTDNTHKSKVLEFFKDFKQDGRFINVEITEKKSRERNRGGGSRRSSGGYGSGRSRNERSKNSGFRSERKGRRGESGVSSKSPRRSSDFKPKGSTFSRPRKSRR